jgi:cell division protein FtsX
VDTIKAIKNVARVDDGADRLGSAIHSLAWLSYGGIILAIGLWVVLLIVCLGHYQSIFYTDAQEIHLIRSFGASKFSIFLPWLLEAVVQSVVTGLICVVVLIVGRGYLTEVYNQFFGALGYEPFVLENGNFAILAIAILLLALIAHVLGGLFALMRGKIA